MGGRYLKTQVCPGHGSIPQKFRKVLTLFDLADEVSPVAQDPLFGSASSASCTLPAGVPSKTSRNKTMPLMD